MVCFITVYTVMLSSQLHKQVEDLENLNRIYNNPKAKVVKGKKQGENVVA